jgi:pyruvate formate lyase activating enzyme
VVFNIQRASTHDGPGLRTTVFFKGCNLRCQWCHNPESWIAAPQLQYVGERCMGCGACAEVCPKGDGACVGCGRCAEVCYAGARVLLGVAMTAREVIQKIEPDAPFYHSSGGGVTFSGGEPMLRPEFLTAVLGMCRARSIHTAVDTAGDVPWAAFEAVRPYTDLFLYDIKCFDGELHRRVTGVGNARIKDNLARLVGAGEKVVVRVPVIPGVNDGDAELAALSGFLHAIGPADVELLPYHKLGARKYEMLGMEDLTAPLAPPEENEMERVRRAYRWN